MAEGGEHKIKYLDPSLDPHIEATVREIAVIQARLTAIEVINSDIKPELKELRQLKWGPTSAWVAAFLVFMGFYAALQREMQASDAQANLVGVTHNERHLVDVEQHLRDFDQAIKDLRVYVNERDDQVRSIMYTKEEHDIFDKERFAKLQEIESRITWLEHRPTK